jgi:hypothetical protein
MISPCQFSGSFSSVAFEAMAPKKRKSSGGDDGPDRRVKSGEDHGGPTPFEINGLPWWSDAMSKLEEILCCGNVEEYVAQKYPSSDAKTEMWQLMSKSFPPVPGIAYATDQDLKIDGQKVALRPFMMGMGTEFGNKGLILLEPFKNLCQLVLVKGFLTDGDSMAVEKLLVTAPNSTFFKGHQLPEAVLVEGGLVSTQSVACVKGWTRSQAWLASALVIMECNLIDKMNPNILQSLSTGFAVVKVFARAADEMDFNRGWMFH